MAGNKTDDLTIYNINFSDKRGLQPLYNRSFYLALWKSCRAIKPLYPLNRPVHLQSMTGTVKIFSISGLCLLKGRQASEAVLLQKDGAARVRFCYPQPAPPEQNEFAKGISGVLLPILNVCYIMNKSALILRLLSTVMKRLPLITVAVFCSLLVTAQQPRMMFSDTAGTGVPLAKDPFVLKYKGRYLMYFSIRKMTGQEHGMDGWAIGIAESADLHNWKKTAEIKPSEEYEKKGLCAPGAIIKDGRVHLFYQTYGNGPKDAICHAVSDDGINFIRDASNPVFNPTGSWNNGRAIDAEVIFFKGRYFLYYASRDPAGKVQLQGVATTPASTDFSRKSWKQASDSPILAPALEWEGACIEGASVIQRGSKLYMFYAGNYNNAPQQIGLAVSSDGINWQRVSQKPFLANGKPGEWNASESGHPDIFKDDDSKTYLFYQGNNDNGKSWYLSNLPIGWTRKGPYVVRTATDAAGRSVNE